MTTDWIAKRRELEQAATEEPWTTEEDWAYIAHGSDSVIHGYYDGKCPACGDEFTDRASVALSIEDAEFIADARTSLPLALKALEKVLDGHVPRDHRPLDGIYLGGKVCNTCRLPWPCSTVVLIREALDVSD